MMDNRPTVCVQGIGFVGFAMSVAVASVKQNGNPLYDVYGVDLPNKIGKLRINDINSGIMPFKTTDDNLSVAFKDVVSQGNFVATSSNKVFSKADVIVVDINLDININESSNPQVDFAPLKEAINSIGQNMKSNALVIIETTVPPGTTSKIIYPHLLSILNKRFPELNKVNLAHSYERVMPGKDYYNSITEFWRVFSGINSESADRCESFLKTIINTKKFPMKKLKSTTSSETAKILENSYRAANIAFINEWGLFAESVGIDLFEVIEAIRLRPTHSNIRRPGLGVGGYCLTKDPLMGFVSCDQIFNIDPIDFEISKRAVDINNKMHENTLNLIEKYFKTRVGKQALILGITYREDVEDTRFSSSIKLIKTLKGKFNKISCHDPMLDNFELETVTFEDDLPNAENFDLIVLAVPHSEYKSIEYHLWLKNFKGLLIDSNNFLNEDQILKLQNLNLKIKIIGRGDI